jgi:glycosyltransferase involved in cell wall biosynthesis
MINKPTILILGKLPPPIIGPAIATNIILNSSLKEEFELIHFDTRINAEVATMGKWSLSKLFKSFELYRKYKAVIKKEEPDLILVPISQTTMGFVKDAPFIRIGAKYAKVVVQLRGSNFKNWLAKANSTTNSFVAKTLKKCDGVIVLGNNLKHLFAEYFEEKQIFVVPNGGNYELQTKKEEALTILYLANFLPSKSFDDVLTAIVILKERGFTNFKMNAAGAWDNVGFKKKCIDIIEAHELSHVTIYPPQAGEAKMQLFADADLFVFCPKMPEGHPWVIVEAMANGLPIIATDKGAIIESVINDVNGFIVPAEQPKIIAEKLEQLINDSALRSQFSNQSKALYAANFTEEKMVKNLKGVFEKVLLEDFV